MVSPHFLRYYGTSGDFVKMGLFVESHSGWSALAFGGNGGMKGAQQRLGVKHGECGRLGMGNHWKIMGKSWENHGDLLLWNMLGMSSSS